MPIYGGNKYVQLQLFLVKYIKKQITGLIGRWQPLIASKIKTEVEKAVSQNTEEFKSLEKELRLTLQKQKQQHNNIISEEYVELIDYNILLDRYNTIDTESNNIKSLLINVKDMLIKIENHKKTLYSDNFNKVDLENEIESLTNTKNTIESQLNKKIQNKTQAISNNNFSLAQTIQSEISPLENQLTTINTQLEDKKNKLNQITGVINKTEIVNNINSIKQIIQQYDSEISTKLQNKNQAITNNDFISAQEIQIQIDRLNELKTIKNNEINKFQEKLNLYNLKQNSDDVIIY